MTTIVLLILWRVLNTLARKRVGDKETNYEKVTHCIIASNANIVES